MWIKQEERKPGSVKVWALCNACKRRSFTGYRRLSRSDDVAGRTPPTRKTTPVVCIGRYGNCAIAHQAGEAPNGCETKSP
jgi:hypothetical protein